MTQSRNHSRHHAREIALQILYRYDVNSNANSLPAGATPEPESKNFGDHAALASELKTHFEHFQVTDGVREFAAELVSGTLQNLHELDLEIEKYASHWRVPRMAVIDRNLLRMALFEMSHFKDIPPSVTIDEAIELAKQFGTADTSAFVNAILDSFRKTRQAG